MTRSHKFNDKDHSLEGGAMTGGHPQTNVPKFFGKHGYADADPKKTKKNGGGKANWGATGGEIIDEEFNFSNARRRSNSSSISSYLENFKTKFEVNEPEPVFEEGIHGAAREEDEEPSPVSSTASNAEH
ncbi:ATPase-stabilizing factor 15 kDa protein [Cladorrhinum sp. PSN332]|nr:ATPase-stabilizing factor 15 kDa protein [Cladorrhinum sp. PSN332]